MVVGFCVLDGRVLGLLHGFVLACALGLCFDVTLVLSALRDCLFSL